MAVEGVPEGLIFAIICGVRCSLSRAGPQQVGYMFVSVLKLMIKRAKGGADHSVPDLWYCSKFAERLE